MSTFSYSVRHRNGWSTGCGPRPAHCSKCDASLPMPPETGASGYGNGPSETVTDAQYATETGNSAPPLKSGESIERSPAVCYLCCAADDTAFMRASGKNTMYFSNGKISNWPGTLSYDTFNVTRSKGYGFGRRHPIVTGRFRFEGQLWSFRNAGAAS